MIKRGLNINNKKILITGAKGQLAGEFIKILKAKNYDLIALTKDELDIASLDKVLDVLRTIKPCFIINCAAYNLVDDAERDWKAAYSINGLGVKNLALAAHEIESILVHFSTDYVFDGEKGDPYTIADKPNPINTYGRSKLLGESFLASLGYPKYYLIRTSWVFGNSKNSFTTKLIEWMSKNSQLRIVDDQISSPTYARDLAYITLKLLETGNYGLYHISNSEFCSRYEWAEFIASKLGWKGKIEPAKSKEFNSPAKRPKFSALDIFPIDEILGISISSWKDATLRYLHFEVLS